MADVIGRLGRAPSPAEISLRPSSRGPGDMLCSLAQGTVHDCRCAHTPLTTPLAFEQVQAKSRTIHIPRCVSGGARAAGCRNGHTDTRMRCMTAAGALVRLAAAQYKDPGGRASRPASIGAYPNGSIRSGAPSRKRKFVPAGADRLVGAMSANETRAHALGPPSHRPRIQLNFSSSDTSASKALIRSTAPGSGGASPPSSTRRWNSRS